MQVIIDSPIRYNGTRYEDGVIEIDDAAAKPLLDAKAIRLVTPSTPPTEKTVNTRKPKDAPTT